MPGTWKARVCVCVCVCVCVGRGGGSASIIFAILPRGGLPGQGAGVTSQPLAPRGQGSPHWLPPPTTRTWPGANECGEKRRWMKERLDFLGWV